MVEFLHKLLNFPDARSLSYASWRLLGAFWLICGIIISANLLCKTTGSHRPLSHAAPLTGITQNLHMSMLSRRRKYEPDGSHGVRRLAFSSYSLAQLSL